jgi:superfamily II DNA or RNA helicase
VFWPGKLAEVYEYLSGELLGNKCVLWACYLPEIRALTGYLNERQPGDAAAIFGAVRPRAREDLRRRFQRGDLPWLVAQPETFRHGTDLAAADTALYFSSPPGLETRQQTEDRIISMDKERLALYVDLITEDTVDESIHEGLRRKESRSNIMFRIVQDAQRRLSERRQ